MSDTSTRSPETRNTYIDAVRGITAIHIVVIHTAWFGIPDVPVWFKNLLLIYEVPLFFYLSGWASSYREPNVIRAGKSILRIWAQWIVFILVINAVCFLTLKLPVSFAPVRDLPSLIKCLFFDEQVYPGFYVIACSTWFIPLYFASVLINNTVLSLIVRTDRPAEYSRTYLIILILTVMWAYFHHEYFSYYPPFIMFYCAIWMIGYLRKDKGESLKGLIIELSICIAGLILCSYLDYRLLGYPYWDIQSAKTTPSGKFLFVSMLSILICRYLKQFVKRPNKILVHIGQNALYYFFGQGVGTSVVYAFSGYLPVHSPFSGWIMGSVINIGITAFVAEGVRLIYRGIGLMILNITKKLKTTESNKVI